MSPGWSFAIMLIIIMADGAIKSIKWRGSLEQEHGFNSEPIRRSILFAKNQIREAVNSGSIPSGVR